LGAQGIEAEISPCGAGNYRYGLNAPQAALNCPAGIGAESPVFFRLPKKNAPGSF
jgi:hypothetical protein